MRVSGSWSTLLEELVFSVILSQLTGDGGQSVLVDATSSPGNAMPTYNRSTCLHLYLIACTVSGLSAQRPTAAVRATQDLRIDGKAANLGRTLTISVAPNLTIAALSKQSATIKFFDSKGAPTGEIGGLGDGPGEFRALGLHGWLGDTLWVYDGDLHRTTFVSPGRTVVRTVPWFTDIQLSADNPARIKLGAGLAPRAYFPDGSIAVTFTFPRSNAARPPWYPETEARAPVARVTNAGIFQQVVAWRPAASGECSFRWTSSAGTSGIVGIPFCPVSVTEISEDGSRIAIATSGAPEGKNASFHIVVLKDNGDTVFARRYSQPVVTISATVSDSTINQMARQGIPGDVLPSIRSSALPRTYPPIRRVLIGRDTSIWVELGGEMADHRWLILDPAGEPIGTLTLPSLDWALVADHTTIWSSEAGADGFPSVVRHHLDWPQ
jgi:hypothetical protein